MTRKVDRTTRVQELIAGFPRYLAAYGNRPAFTRAGQLEFHVETIRLRRELGSAIAAVRDDRFLHSLYQTLNAWGIGRRASRLIPEAEFAAALRAKETEIAELDRESLEAPNLNVEATCRRVWKLVDELGIIQNDTRIVSGTKTLHHLLPDLVTPMDREYTQKFFLWHNPQFQYDQARKFQVIFQAFADVARAVMPSQFITGGWNSSPTKVIDNAVVGFVTLEQPSSS
ncbi:MAG: hypothetical protein AB7O31_11655 [Burkholderiales bacterium]